MVPRGGVDEGKAQTRSAAIRAGGKESFGNREI